MIRRMIQPLVFLGALLAAACSPSIPSPNKSPCSLVFQNTTSEPVEVYLHQDYLGTVNPGKTQSFRGILPGNHPFEIHQKNHRLHKGMLTFTAGSQTFYPQDVPPTGRITFFNQWPLDLALHLDGQPVGTGLSGDEITLEDIPPGNYLLVARSETQSVDLRWKLQVRSGEASQVQALYANTEIELFNNAAFPLSVEGIGGDTKQILAGEQLRLTRLLPGAYSIKVRGKDGVMERNLRLSMGEQQSWILRPSSCALKVINQLQLPVQLQVEGEVVRELNPGETVRLNGLSAGNFSLIAENQDEKIYQAYQVELTPGVVPIWKIASTKGDLHVRNPSSEPFKLEIANRRAEIMAPRSSKIVKSLPLGQLQAVATGRYSGTFTVFSESIEAGEIARWVLPSPTGTVTCLNEGLQTATVTFPEIGDISLAPGQRIQLDGIVAGKRDFQVKLGTVEELQKATVLPEGMTSIRIRERSAALKIHNHTGHRLGLDGHSIEPLEIEPQTTISAILPIGKHRLTATNWDDGSTDEYIVQVRPDGSSEWSIASRSGTLLIQNEYSRDLLLQIAGFKTVFLRARATLTLLDIPPGTYELIASSEDATIVQRRRFSIQSEKPSFWHLREPPTTLVLENGTRENLQVYMQGIPTTVLEPQDRKQLRVYQDSGGVIDIRGLETGRQSRFLLESSLPRELQMRVQDTLKVTRFVNESEVPLEVIFTNIDAPTLRIPPDSIGRLTHPARTLQVEQRHETQTATAIRVQPREHQVNVIPMQKTGKMLWVSNRTPLPLELLACGQILNSVLPGIGFHLQLPDECESGPIQAVDSKGNTWYHPLPAMSGAEPYWNIRNENPTR